MSQGIEFSEHEVYIAGPITDVHMHPRIFDVRFPYLPDSPNGKAGVDIYSATALRSGFAMGLAMLNESMRVYSPDGPGHTREIKFPVNKAERLLYAVNAVTANSRIKMGLNMIVDPSILGFNERGEGSFNTEKIEEEYSSPEVQQFATALKIYGAETTGGYAILLEHIIPVAEVWHKYNPDKPVILHLEDGNVRRILEVWPPHIPVHIAHVSSRQEFEPIIEAIESGKNVTCETTPHHMFLTELTRQLIDAYGCMKPSLKSEADRKFLWDNLRYITMFASDCAPHRPIDKVGIDGDENFKPAFGVTNHDVFLPLFFQAIREGRLTEQELFERLVTNPIKRFNLPNFDVTTKFDLKPISALEATIQTPYGCSPFPLSPETPPMRGQLAGMSIAGKLAVEGSQLKEQSLPRYENIISF